MRRLILALFLFTTSAAFGDAASAIDDYFTRLAAHGFSGAVLVARGDEVLLRKGYGMADRKRGISNRSDTAFSISSLDKQFIAAGILRLEEMGKLSTGDPLARFFDFAPDDKKNITLHQVLTHTAGFSDEYWDQHPELTHAEFIKWVLTQRPLDSPPGKEWSYVTFDYWLLEEVIERASGLPFEQFLRRELFEPAGMQFTGFALPKWNRDNVAHTALWTVPSSALPGESKYDDPLARPAAWRVMMSTPEDLYRWYLALRAGRVLTPESRRKLFTPVMENYAYGWYVVPTSRGTKLIHHGGGGSDVGSVVTFRWFADEDAFVVVTNNSISGFSNDYVMGDVEALLFGGSGLMPPPSIVSGAAAASAAEQQTAAGSGRRSTTYRLPGGGTFEVIQVPNGPLVAVSRDAEAIAALLLGGTDGGSLPQDDVPRDALLAARRGGFDKLGALQDVATMHYRPFFSDGIPEMHAFLKLRFAQGDAYVRVIHLTSRKRYIDRLRTPEGIEAVLAPSPHGGYTTWDPRLGSAVRVDFVDRAVRLTGSAGAVIATRVPQP
jgi:CubicO group peptidase (beta-lactamase class C family)